MGAEQDALPAYFNGTSAEFQVDADMVLQLRDGAHLPVHSQLLASASPVLCKIIKVAANQVHTEKMVLPFHEFSKREAVDILKARGAFLTSFARNV
jgi:hypothetical protein